MLTTMLLSNVDSVSHAEELKSRNSLNLYKNDNHLQCIYLYDDMNDK